ncbi:hypothetical protein EDC65_0582 [Stella humosa]|uniref:Uncharacterized protein n=2 Tax=Stella humosa TaxID=94 RepID=A0A3N1MCG2_9PROT|nr:hypothetical protein EDC65_0582 [Stella humosa]BBK31779.1 hypothetical protein STHU_24130 [Stella humosa]
MNKALRLTACLALALQAGAPAALACEPEAMNEQLAELCRVPLEELSTMLSAVKQPPEATAALRSRLEDARNACRDGEFEVGALSFVRLARDIGRLEARTLAALGPAISPVGSAR